MSSKSAAWSSTTGSRMLDSATFIVRRWMLAAGILVLLLLSITLSSSEHRKAIPSAWSKYRKSAGSYLRNDVSGGVNNATLGFQKVFAIGMPGRTDKSDALELAASITDIDITWVEGVATIDVPRKSYPETWDVPEDSGNLGSYRAHLNVLAKIVKERIQTALILEDDTDWDVTLKDQLSIYSQGVRNLQDSSHPESQYGSDWDLHWLGHCRAGPSGRDQSVFVIHDDTTVPPIPHRRSLWRHGYVPDFVLSNTSRVVFDCHAAMCTFAYAVTFNGARKILASLSQAPDYAPFDVAMSAMCGNRHLTPFTCYSVYPPIMASHRFAGNLARDSDIIDRVRNFTHPEFTLDIVHSTIINTKRIITGEDSALSQWPDDTFAESRPLKASYLDEVKTEVRNIEWRMEDQHTLKGINSH